MSINVNEPVTPIRELRPGQRNVNVTCIVLSSKQDAAINKENQPLYQIWVSDYSGSVILSLWGSVYKDLVAGDMLRLLSVTPTFRLNRMVIMLGNVGKLVRYGQDMLLFSIQPNMSHVKFEEEKDGREVFWEPVGEIPYSEWSSYPGTSIIDAQIVPWAYNRNPSKKVKY